MKKLSVLLLFCGIALLSYSQSEGELLWSDEFDGDTYDHTVWTPKLGLRNPFSSSAPVYCTEENIAVRDGNLLLKGDIYPANPNDGYTSAELSSQGKQPFQYGRVEARFRLPKGRGTGANIWLYPQENIYGQGIQSGWIDLLYFMGNNNQLEQTAFMLGNGSNLTGDSSGALINIPGGDSDFHTVALDWDADSICWYFDGTLSHRYLNPHEGEWLIPGIQYSVIFSFREKNS
jgi:beta-glucanase (GH16 family)